MNIWFTSDTHYHHKNIVRGTTAWADDPSKGAASVQQTRDFATLEEHDDTLVNNINKVVGENDILYHLGDWSFGGIEQIWEFRKRLNCKTIHLILGNHDHHIEKNAILPNVISATPYGSDFIDGKNSDPEYPDYVEAQRLFASVNPILIRKVGGHSMTLLHYAMRTWDKAHHGSWMLYGHSHGTLPDYKTEEKGKILYKEYDQWEYREAVTSTKVFKTMDVGIDTHPEFRPYHIDEVRKIMNRRAPLLVDHHTKDTN